VKCANRDFGPIGLIDQSGHTLTHFFRRFIGKRQCHDAATRDAFAKKMRNPACDHPRFASAGSCED
jgi:hypothetical protein